MILLYQVVYPRLIYPLLTGTSTGAIVFSHSTCTIHTACSSNHPATYLHLVRIPFTLLIGAGAAFAIGGAVLGTIFPQSFSTINLFDLAKDENNILEGAIILIATVTTLMYFYFGAKFENGKPIRRAAWIETIAKIGQLFLIVTLGAIYAGVFITAITALVGRVQSIWQLFELIK